MRIFALVSLLALTVSITACGQRGNRATAEADVRSYPFGLDKVYETAQNAKNLHSLLVSYQGNLSEAYFHRYASDTLDHVRSVTKSVMSTLIGIAIEKGFIESLDSPAYQYAGSYRSHFKGQKKDITIRHLLSMSSGLQWTEESGNSEYNEWVTSRDPILYFLDRPVAHKPGTYFAYNTASFHLLSLLLENASGLNTLEFADKFLFNPLGFSKVRWEKLRPGYYNGGAGLELHPRDMVQFGQLYADKGLYKEKRIISEAYMLEATSPQQPEGSDFRPGQGYGLGWWLGEEEGIKGFMAQGFAGQVIAVAPQFDLVFAITHDWHVGGKQLEQQAIMAYNTLTRQILEAIVAQEER
ncbi:MAG: serine hydrolase [Roseivirga sp.]|nr:serine hydrolase [Roseivirga sp.]